MLDSDPMGPFREQVNKQREPWSLARVSAKGSHHGVLGREEASARPEGSYIELYAKQLLNPPGP